jgi:succinyl-diaminopimelate desuccinylase
MNLGDIHMVMDLEAALDRIEGSREDIISVMSDMIRIPALAPANGGEGESKRADMLQGCLIGFDSVIRVDVIDEDNPSIVRPNILAKKNGKEKGTVWIIAHMDTVPAGDLCDWDTPPFEPVVKDGKIYGRGTEDNGQSIVSSMFASMFIEAGTLSKKSLGIAYVADEETTSRMGIAYLIEHDYFSPDDVFIVPDWGSPEGRYIDVSEKNLIWLQYDVIGKSTHGSTPHLGINAYKVGVCFLTDLMDELDREFSVRDEMFDPPMCTFEPTKSAQTVSNVNTIPGKYNFSMDMRLIPKYEIDDIVATAERVAARHEKETGAKITVKEVQRHVSGKASSIRSPVFHALSDSVESVTGIRPKGIGVGGATCANFFREEGYDAYVWQYGGGSLHGPNEYVVVDSIIIDAKVFATLFYKLCV